MKRVKPRRLADQLGEQSNEVIQRKVRQRDECANDNDTHAHHCRQLAQFLAVGPLGLLELDQRFAVEKTDLGKWVSHGVLNKVRKVWKVRNVRKS